MGEVIELNETPTPPGLQGVADFLKEAKGVRCAVVVYVDKDGMTNYTIRTDDYTTAAMLNAASVQATYQIQGGDDGD